MATEGIDLRALVPVTIAAFLMGSAAAFAVASSLPTVFEARARLAEATAERALGPGAAEDATTRQRLELYARVAESEPIMESAVARLGLDVSPAALAKQVRSFVSSDGTTVEIVVRDGEAALAATLANVIAEEVVRAASEDTAATSTLASVIDEELNARLQLMETLQGRVERLSSTDVLTRGQQRRLRRLSRRLESAPGSYARLVPHSSESGVGALAIADPALTPLIPVSPIPLADAFLGGMAAVILVLPLVFAPRFLKQNVSAAEDVHGLVPVLAVVPRVAGDWRQPSRWQRAVLLAPDLAAADTYRRTSIGLEMASPRLRRSVILVAAPRRSASKSALAANLALAMAAAGRKVVLLDGDLDRPASHRMLGIDNGPGLAEALAGDVADPNALLVAAPFGLQVLTAGDARRHRREHIGTAAMKSVVSKLQSDHDVIVDSPPLRDSAAGEVLGPAADGVSLCMSAGLTRRSEVTDALRELEWVGVRVLGAVIVHLPPRIFRVLVDRTPRRGLRVVPAVIDESSWPRAEVRPLHMMTGEGPGSGARGAAPGSAFVADGQGALVAGSTGQRTPGGAAPTPRSPQGPRP